MTRVAVNFAGAANYQQLTSLPSDCVVGKVIAAGLACSVRFRFDPVTAGLTNPIFTVSSNAPDAEVGLLGTGTRPR